MNMIIYTPEFEQWLKQLKDAKTKARLIVRLTKVTNGNMGDVKYVGDGVYEMREHFGTGYRMYYIQQGDTLILMLGGGDKSSQSKDIAKAIALSKHFKE